MEPDQHLDQEPARELDQEMSVQLYQDMYSLRAVSRMGQQDASPSWSRTVGAGCPNPLGGEGDTLPRQCPPREAQDTMIPWGNRGSTCLRALTVASTVCGGLWGFRGGSKGRPPTPSQAFRRSKLHFEISRERDR